MPLLSGEEDEGAWLEKVPGRHLLPCAANIYGRGPVAWILRLKMRGLRQAPIYMGQAPDSLASSCKQTENEICGKTGTNNNIYSDRFKTWLSEPRNPESNWEVQDKLLLSAWHSHLNLVRRLDAAEDKPQFNWRGKVCLATSAKR